MKNAPNNVNIEHKNVKKSGKPLIFWKYDTSNSHFIYFCICF